MGMNEAKRYTVQRIGKGHPNGSYMQVILTHGGATRALGDAELEDALNTLAETQAELERCKATLALCLPELVEYSDGGCDHTVGICCCNLLRVIDQVRVDLGEIAYCDCPDDPTCCDKCHGSGIVNLQPTKEQTPATAEEQGKVDADG